MGVRSAVYGTVVGEYSISVPELAFRKIVSVKREGIGYDIVRRAPVNREVQYATSYGSFTFENAFTGTPGNPFDVSEFPTSEKIFIIWDE